VRRIGTESRHDRCGGQAMGSGLNHIGDCGCVLNLGMPQVRRLGSLRSLMQVHDAILYWFISTPSARNMRQC
jgi:hypothetical protein